MAKYELTTLYSVYCGVDSYEIMKSYKVLTTTAKANPIIIRSSKNE